MEISKKLKLMRKENNLTLKELSTKSGISISFISDIENGRRNPSIEKLKILAHALDIPAREFLKEETDYLINGGETEEVMVLARDINIRRIERARSKMEPKDKEKMMRILEASFEDYFNDED